MVKKHISDSGIKILVSQKFNPFDPFDPRVKKLEPYSADMIIPACNNLVPRNIDSMFGFNISTGKPYPENQKVTCKRCISAMKRHGL